MSEAIYIPIIAGVVSFVVFYALGLLTALYLRKDK